MYNGDFDKQTGWICNSCHRSFAPWVRECPYCGANSRVVSSDNTSITTDVHFIPTYTTVGSIYDHEWFKKIEDPILEYINEGFGLPPMDKI